MKLNKLSVGKQIQTGRKLPYSGGVKTLAILKINFLFINLRIAVPPAARIINKNLNHYNTLVSYLQLRWLLAFM